MGWEKRRRGIFFPSSLEIWTVRVKQSGGKKKRLKRREKRESCSSFPISHKRLRPFHPSCPQLSSPFPLQFSDCSRLPGNRSSVETVSERRSEKKRVRGESGRPNRHDRSECLTLSRGDLELNGLYEKHQSPECPASCRR